MRKIARVIGMWVVGLSVTSLAFAQDWKGKPDPSQFSAGAITGMGIIDGSVGYALLGTVSKKILPQGFISDITNSVSIEGALGPVFLSNVTAAAYSVHLRWDFVKDINWTFYGLGGVGGSIMDDKLGGNRFELTPRFGVGTFFSITEVIRGRAEVSHDLIAVGVNFTF
jgi:hypothetical protein